MKLPDLMHHLEILLELLHKHTAQHQILLFQLDSEGFRLFTLMQMVMGSSMNHFHVGI